MTVTGRTATVVDDAQVCRLVADRVQRRGGGRRREPRREQVAGVDVVGGRAHRRAGSPCGATRRFSASAVVLTR